MSTCVFYIDEAGSLGRYSIPIRPERGETAVFCLFALAFPLSDWREFDRDYLRLKRHYFASEIGRSGSRAEQWEIKGKDLCAPRNRGSHRRHAFLREVFDLCERYSGTSFGVTFLKDPSNPMGSRACYGMALQFLAERFNAYVVESSTYLHGVMIADKRMGPLDHHVASSHLSYLFGHETGRSLTRMVESPLFADSRLTAGLQITDNLASVLFANHYYYYCRSIQGAPDYSHIAQRYWPKLDSLQFKSKQRFDGFSVYGYKLCDHRQST